MADEKSAVNQFIESLKTDNANDKLLENLLPQQKAEDVKQPEGEPEEKEVPFNKNPKVKRYIEKEVKKALSQMAPQTQEYIQDNPDELKDLIDSFTRIVGNDKPENAQLVEKFGKTMADFRDRALKAQELVENQQEEVQQEEEAEEELNQGFDEIEEEFKVDLWDEKNRKLKGQFLDYVEDISHKDKDGDIDEFPDIVGAYRSFSKIQRRENPTTAAKDLADRSGTKGSSGSGAPNQQAERITFDNIGNKIDRMFGN
jgi:uncharacterized protein with von Willebrand factor type A (vWA) domain